MSTAQRTSRPPVHYPDSDGKPIAENTLQFRWIVTIKEGLDACVRQRPDVFVAGGPATGDSGRPILDIGASSGLTCS